MGSTCRWSNMRVTDFVQVSEILPTCIYWYMYVYDRISRAVWNRRMCQRLDSQQALFLSPESMEASAKPTNTNSDQRQSWYARTDNSHKPSDKQKVHTLERSNRNPNQQGMSKARKGNIASAVRVFERWLWEANREEKRGMHKIPPEELDKYLCDFFVQVRLPNGSNYSLSSFKSLRSNLDFYLKCANYPVSVTTSYSFRQSQAAFRKKMNVIKALSAQNLTVCWKPKFHPNTSTECPWAQSYVLGVLVL